jgi:hypothetical protein
MLFLMQLQILRELSKPSKASTIKPKGNGLGLSGVAGSCSVPSLVALGSIPCQCMVYWRVQYRVG